MSSSVRGGVGIKEYGCRRLLEAASTSTCLDGFELLVISVRCFRFRGWRFDRRCVWAVLVMVKRIVAAYVLVKILVKVWLKFWQERRIDPKRAVGPIVKVSALRVGPIVKPIVLAMVLKRLVHSLLFIWREKDSASSVECVVDGCGHRRSAYLFVHVPALIYTSL